jgi:hypothetical protein
LERRKRLSQVLQEVTQEIQQIQSKRKETLRLNAKEKEELRKTIGFYEYEEQRKLLEQVPSYERRRRKSHRQTLY